MAYVPPTAFAVNAGAVARPDASLATCATTLPPNEPDAPLAGARNATLTCGKGWRAEWVTAALIATGNSAPAPVPWGVPARGSRKAGTLVPLRRTVSEFARYAPTTRSCLP